MSPFLSIIIPAYNVEKYLPQCLDSVVRQNNGEIEVILVNDGSTDSTLEVCREYERQYDFIHFFDKGNEGLPSTRNFGIRKAQGEYLNFLDSDDFLPDGALEKLIQRLKERKPDVLIGLYDSLWEADGKITPCDYHLEASRVEQLTGEALLDYLMNGRIYGWYAWLNTVSRKFLLENALLFSEKFTTFEDVRWTPFVLAMASNVSYIDSPLYVYRRSRAGSITATFSKGHFYSKLAIFNDIGEKTKNHNFSDETVQRLLINMSNLYVSALFDTWSFPKAERKQYLEQLKPYRFILANSPRRYHRLLSALWGVTGITFVSYLLYLRAQWVRKRKIKE